MKKINFIILLSLSFCITSMQLSKAANDGTASAEVLSDVISTQFTQQISFGKFIIDSNAPVFTQENEAVVAINHVGSIVFASNNIQHKGSQNIGSMSIQTNPNLRLRITADPIKLKNSNGDEMNFTPFFANTPVLTLGFRTLDTTTNSNGNLQVTIAGQLTMDKDISRGVYSGNYAVNITH